MHNKLNNLSGHSQNNELLDFSLDYSQKEFIDKVHPKSLILSKCKTNFQ